MKEKIYKYSVIALVIINFITLYLFYDYLTEEPSMFQGLGLYINFIRIIFTSIGLGIFLLIIRFYLYLTKKKNYLKTNFFYVFTAIFNAYTLLNSLLCVFLDLLHFQIEFILFTIGLFLISVFMIFDIYKNNFRN